MRQSLILTSLLTSLFLGCDTAARQQQAEEARREQTVNDLRELGEEMHNNQKEKSTADPATTDDSGKIPEE